MKLSAVIFDFDGVIVDTEPIHYAAFQEVLAPRGLSYSWDEYVETFIGYDDRDGLRAAYKRAQKDLDADELPALVQEKAAAFLALIDRDGVEAYPGAVELIRSLRGRIPLGLCSGALQSDIDPILKQLDLVDVFEEVVTADQVARSKPDPESYQSTLNRLRERHGSGSCVVDRAMAIEDTPAGIASARGAGMRVLAVTNSYERDSLVDATTIVDSLESVTLQTLDELVDV